MKLAVQTIPWVGNGTEVPEMLDQIEALDVQGIEFAHSPDVLRPVDALRARLESVGLQFLGISGGAFADRVDLVKEYMFLGPCEFTPYVYLDEWEAEDACLAMDQGIALAFHPHMFRPVQTAADAEKLLDDFDRLRILPDTAHLTVAGEDVVEVLNELLKVDRIAAIHLKDWTPEFGRAYQFYSRGFVGLGEGDVPLDDVIGVLRLHRYNGWLVIEQDSANDPAESVRGSLCWLKELMK